MRPVDIEAAGMRLIKLGKRKELLKDNAIHSHLLVMQHIKCVRDSSNRVSALKSGSYHAVRVIAM